MSEQQLKLLSKDDLILKVLESEAILNEFQESSKDLEKALEDELQELELNNLNLVKKIDSLNKQLNKLKSQINDLTKESSDLQELLLNKDEEINNLQQKLVKIEIINDSMESQDRVIQNKYEIQQQFNNELLEKIALIDDDYERVKKSSMEKQLFLTNYENQIKELKIKIESLETIDRDVSMISFKDMLKSTPPPNKIRQGNTIKKSDSLRKLKNLTLDIEAFLDSSKSNKVLKSPSTTQLTTKSEKGLSYSKRFSNLPSINGSPTPTKNQDFKEKPKSSKTFKIV
ncbi:unnamed protein product [Candida verbasci]|uniref:SWI5-dependent HO expression protein 3 n=1 Tax=Candida verbasci TaxID=1227364 RepID=A0A9W4XB50_9ASCO|nr:unnamed protein product [Candida verbasci]